MNSGSVRIAELLRFKGVDAGFGKITRIDSVNAVYSNTATVAFAAVLRRSVQFSLMNEQVTCRSGGSDIGLDGVFEVRKEWSGQGF